MHFIYRIPGYLLLIFGGFCLSWGGFIVRSFETTNGWDILFLRSLFFFFGISFFLVSIYKKNVITVFKTSGTSAMLGGFAMSFSFIAFVFAMIKGYVIVMIFFWFMGIIPLKKWKKIIDENSRLARVSDSLRIDIVDFFHWEDPIALSESYIKNLTQP